MQKTEKIHNLIPKNYDNVLKDLLVLIRTNQAKAIQSVNTVLLETYWKI